MIDGRKRNKKDRDESMKIKTAKIINGILYTILGIILLSNLFILFQAKTNDDKVPAIFGYKPFIVMSGSMESEIFTDDLIFVKTIDPDKLEKQDIIAFRTSDNVVVTHRIVNIYEQDGTKMFVTKGDNNKGNDGEPVSENAVEGIYKARIPKLGAYFLFINTPTGMILSILVAVVIIFIYAFVNMSIDKKQTDKENEKYRKEFEEFKRKAKSKE